MAPDKTTAYREGSALLHFDRPSHGSRCTLSKGANSKNFMADMTVGDALVGQVKGSRRRLFTAVAVAFLQDVVAFYSWSLSLGNAVPGHGVAFARTVWDIAKFPRVFQQSRLFSTTTIRL
jgi:hypothetical protein